MEGYFKDKSEWKLGKWLKWYEEERTRENEQALLIQRRKMDFEEAKHFKPSVIFPDTVTNKLV